jgi:hypothetical protein
MRNNLNYGAELLHAEFWSRTVVVWSRAIQNMSLKIVATKLLVRSSQLVLIGPTDLLVRNNTNKRGSAIRLRLCDSPAQHYNCLSSASPLLLASRRRSNSRREKRSTPKNSKVFHLLERTNTTRRPERLATGAEKVRIRDILPTRAG